MDMEKWTTENIPALSGKVIIVTGGNSGLGYESVKAFSEKGAEVIMACRSIEKGMAAKAEIGKQKGNISVMELDLMDFKSIKTFADNFKNKYDRLDVLLNNAGIMTTPYFLTKDGLEAQMGTNHFGHFVLTGQLFEVIKNTPGSRVVNVSSSAHKSGKMDFDNLLFENGKDYSPLKAYSRSKLANLLFTYELQRFFEKERIDSIAVAAHPGVSQTNLAAHLEKKWWFTLLKPLFMVISQRQDMGALPQIRAAVDPNVKGSEYYGPHKGMKGFPVIVTSNEASQNRADAKKLWEVSEKITEINY
jgi:NAD(P)-dependent dehydrogenase (short-subunit alcohol dehydrogenase family)